MENRSSNLGLDDFDQFALLNNQFNGSLAHP